MVQPERNGIIVIERNVKSYHNVGTSGLCILDKYYFVALSNPTSRMQEDGADGRER